MVWGGSTLPGFAMNLLFVCVSLFGLFHTGTSTYEDYRIDEIKPKCKPVSAPICMPTKYEVSSPLGRYRRSASDNSRVDTKFKTRNKRWVRSNTQQWRYNTTTFPNFANDRTPEEVMESLVNLHPMIATSCSKYLQLFLCSVYSPVCTEFGVVPPCRELCEKVVGDCERTMRDFGIEWPDRVRCSLFPKYGNQEGVSNEIEFFGGEAMYDGDVGFMIQRIASLTWMGSLAADGKICIPPSDDDVIGPQLKLLAENIHLRPSLRNSSRTHHTKANHQYGLWCPAEMRSPPGQSGYSFLGMENCSPPCPNMYLSDEQLSGIRTVIVFMSSLCIIVTFFTLCTFLMDAQRFRYPERPIVFYALSYFIVSVVFMVGYILQEGASCNEEIRDAETHDIVQGFTVVKGNHKQTCTIIFMVLYYFTVNGTIWWLILTVTWLLAAGFKWGTEAIEKYSMYYHAIAWGIPAFQTMTVVTFNKIEGDNIAGVCFLGLYDSEGLRYMLLIPLSVYLFVGISILCTGFCCLNRVRIKLGDNADKRKLSKFMLRIGVFSVLYIVPQIILLVLYIVEDYNRTRWEASWFLKACDEYRVPCPADGSNVTISAGEGDDQPHVLLFCTKYIMTLIVALPPLFWVASKKTIQSWKTFFSSGCTSTPRGVTVNSKPKVTRTNNNSKKPLLPEESLIRKANNYSKRTVGDGDDVFISFEGTNNIHGSSASVAARVREENDRNSRQNAILQHVIKDIESALPPPTLPPENQEIPSALDQNISQKQFPEKRRHRDARLNDSSLSTSTPLTASMQMHSSSLSSLTSERRRHRRKRRSSHRTSSLTRAEFKEKLTQNRFPKTAHSAGSLHALEGATSSRTSLTTEKPRPPPKPRRTASLMSQSQMTQHSVVSNITAAATVNTPTPPRADENTVEL